MENKKQLTETKKNVIKYFIENTDMFLYEIAYYTGCAKSTVAKLYRKTYSSTYRTKRNNMQYSKTKLGKLNPMYGKRGNECPNYVGEVSDCKGYLMVVKPDWYTGRKGSHHVFKHSVVVCENLGLTEIPKGYCVHHCDLNPHNNSFDNLVLMTLGEHASLHSTLEGATTISKESTLKWVEERRALKAKI